MVLPGSYIFLHGKCECFQVSLDCLANVFFLSALLLSPCITGFCQKSGAKWLLHQGRRKRPHTTPHRSRPYATWNPSPRFWWNHITGQHSKKCDSLLSGGG